MQKGIKPVFHHCRPSFACFGWDHGLAIDGKVLVLAASGDAIEVSPLQLIPGSRAIVGRPSGTAVDSQNTLNFSALTGVRAMVESYPLEQAEQAYQRMMSNQARFRVVLTP